MYKDELFKGKKDKRIEGSIIKGVRSLFRIKKIEKTLQLRI